MGTRLYDRKPFGAFSVSDILSSHREIWCIDRGTSWGWNPNEYGEPEEVTKEGRLLVDQAA